MPSLIRENMGVHRAVDKEARLLETVVRGKTDVLFGRLVNAGCRLGHRRLLITISMEETILGIMILTITIMTGFGIVIVIGANAAVADVEALQGEETTLTHTFLHTVGATSAGAGMMAGGQASGIVVMVVVTGVRGCNTKTVPGLHVL